MDVNTGFLIYATLFRLAVIASATISIILGYLLFIKAKVASSRQGTDIEGQFGGYSLTLRSAAPGTCFALFGSAILVTMLSQGNPQLVIEELQTMSQVTADTKTVDAKTGQVMSVSKKTTMKGSGDESYDPSLEFQKQYDEAMQHLKGGNETAAMTALGKSLSRQDVSLGLAAMAVNRLAEMYQNQNRDDEALSLARLAVTVDRNNVEYIATLATIQCKRGQYDEALRMAKIAVAREPNNSEFLYTLALCQKGSGDLSAASETIRKAARIAPTKYEPKITEFN